MRRSHVSLSNTPNVVINHHAAAGTSRARDLDPALHATVRPTLTWSLEICNALVNMCGKTLDLMARNAFWLLER
jgi:hypothetical protein